MCEKSDTGLTIIEREGIVTKAGGAAVGFINDSVLYKSRYRESDWGGCTLTASSVLQGA
jgi:hypothetical protein